jgi:hypothetical protein
LAKLIVLSIIIVSFVLPIAMATRPRPRIMLRRVQWITLAWVVVWAYLCVTWYTRLVPLD